MIVGLKTFRELKRLREVENLFLNLDLSIFRT
jgi:hypothetical protein